MKSELKVKCETCDGKLIACASGDIVCSTCGLVSQKYVFIEGEIFEV